MTNKERFKEIFISQVTRPGAADLLAWLGTTDFFEAPASTRFHGAYPGGLVEHSLNVYYALLGQSTIREYGGESVAVVALLHDVCKTGYYRRERDGKYSVKDRLPMGHGEKSVYLVMKFMDLTDEEALAIRWHMGAYDDAFRGGSRALNEAQDKCALVLALHHATGRRRKRSSPREEKSGATRWRRRHGPRRSPARSLTAWASMNITSAPWPQRWRGVRSWSGRPTHAFPCSRRDNTGL